MKHIIKSIEPQYFIDAKEKITNKQQDPWENDQNIKAIREELRIDIANEQYQCCAYCERAIKSNDVTTCDIDHFKKRNLFPRLILDYSNLLVSCKNKRTYCSGYKDDHFGQIMGRIAKKHQLTIQQAYRYIINPVDSADDPEHYFDYLTSSCKILVKEKLTDFEKEKAMITIELFNLNHPELIRARQKALIETKSHLKSNKKYTLEELRQKLGFYSFIKKLFCN